MLNVGMIMTREEWRFGLGFHGKISIRNSSAMEWEYCFIDYTLIVMR